MERVLGDRVAIASSTNSCGTGLRGLTANRASPSGRKERLRDFDMRAKNRAPFILPTNDDFISLTWHLANCHLPGSQAVSRRVIAHWRPLEILIARNCTDSDLRLWGSLA